jgi:hypothetical protein
MVWTLSYTVGKVVLEGNSNTLQGDIQALEETNATQKSLKYGDKRSLVSGLSMHPVRV